MKSPLLIFSAYLVKAKWHCVQMKPDFRIHRWSLSLFQNQCFKESYGSGFRELLKYNPLAHIGFYRVSIQVTISPLCKTKKTVEKLDHESDKESFKNKINKIICLRPLQIRAKHSGACYLAKNRLRFQWKFKQWSRSSGEWRKNGQDELRWRRMMF